MRRSAFLLLVLLPGCATTGGLYLTPPESAVRLPIRERAVPLLEKVLRRDGWTGAVRSATRTGIVAPTVADGWSEDTLVLEVTATTADGQPLLVPVGEYTQVLEALRRRLRDLVEDYGGGQVDWQIVEGHAERTLVFQYKVKEVAGVVRVRMTPLAERPDELVTRVEFTVREQ